MRCGRDPRLSERVVLLVDHWERFTAIESIKEHGLIRAIGHIDRVTCGVDFRQLERPKLRVRYLPCVTAIIGAKVRAVFFEAKCRVRIQLNCNGDTTSQRRGQISRRSIKEASLWRPRDMEIISFILAIDLTMGKRSVNRSVTVTVRFDQLEDACNRSIVIGCRFWS